MTTILALSGSLRAASRNTGLLRCAQAQAPRGVSVEIADLRDIPFYNADHPEPTPAVAQFFAQLERCDALLLACPEYNYSIAPVLKNALDWASRAPNNSLLAGKPTAIVSAGGGMGGSRAQYHLRQVAVCLKLNVLLAPELFANAFGPDFNEAGDVVGERTRALVAGQLDALLALR
ncbi:NADPH-dependent FMN reductase [Roseateles sp. BYS180W]|uniref:NADPH-dependent FMN reductase n=1 Tax=Roseateles rivi TaxID=3299028 RepID=A0ABW7FY52_9BURK